MSNGQLFWQISFMCSAVLTGVIISFARFSSLTFPMSAIRRKFTALPMWTIFTAEMSREPFKPTLVSTKALCCTGFWNRPFLSALFTCVCDAVRFTSPRAMATLSNLRRLDCKWLPAFFAINLYQWIFCALRTCPRTVDFFWHSRIVFKNIFACWTC